MLLEFSCQNFRFVKDKITLSLIANSSKEQEATHVFSPLPGYRLLPGAAIYGPNASGKSSIFEAFRFMKNQVITSTNNYQNGGIPVEPHLFDEKSIRLPSEVEAIFCIGDTVYQYGFCATKERFTEEWLFAQTKGRWRSLISREFDPKTGNYKIKVNTSIKGKRKILIDTTREDALLLSKAIEMNTDTLRPVFEWFLHGCKIITKHELPRLHSAINALEPHKLDAVIHALNASDLDISGISIRGEQNSPEVFLVHKTASGNSVEINLKSESTGTQKVFGLIGPWLEILEKGKTVFFDELSDGLHPILVEYLVSMFHKKEINKHGAQIIFTTHGTSLLKPGHLRRDQVWFTSKKIDNSAKLYPLSDFSPRKGRENLERNYLNGNYGALPYCRDSSD